MCSLKNTISLAEVCLVVLVLVPASNLSPVMVDSDTEVPWLSRSYNTQNPDLQPNMYQGDILLADGFNIQGKNALKVEAYKWPKGIIPFIFHEKFPVSEREKVLKAMERLQSETCIRFVPLKTRVYKTFIEISNNKKGCFAMIGYHPQKNGQGVPVNLQIPECTNHQGTIEHELLHVIGLLHEQARSDRDQYVKILWENIDRTYWNDFGKASPKDVTHYGVPYDYVSVMHYPHKAFSKNGKETIVAKKDPKTPLGQRVGATNGDLEKVRQMYCRKSDDDGLDQVEDNRILDVITEYFE